MMHDTWTWSALYTDGTQLDEYDEDRPEGRGFAEIDQSKLHAFVLIPSDESAHRTHVLRLGDGMRPIFFRRRMIETNVEMVELARATVHCLGFQTTANGKNVASYTFLFDDGSVLVTSDHNAI